MCIIIIGVTHLIKADMVKEGAAVIDVGESRIKLKICAKTSSVIMIFSPCLFPGPIPSFQYCILKCIERSGSLGTMTHHAHAMRHAPKVFGCIQRYPLVAQNIV